MTTRFGTMDQAQTVLDGTEGVDFTVPRRAERLECIARTWVQLAYWRRGKRDRGVLVRDLRRVTGYARRQLTRPIGQSRATGRIADGRKGPARPFAARCTAADAALPAEVDALHSGDWDGVKGLYVIDLVDEVTHCRLMAGVPRLNEGNRGPHPERMLEAFAFRVLGFHTDNGSESVNHRVAGLLDKLRVEFTKSRPRRGNDNALVESKNGSAVRTHLGYAHIPAQGAAAVNADLREHLWADRNCHRPCFFPSAELDAKGRRRKRYRYQHLMTPSDKPRSLPDAGQYLEPGLGWQALDTLAGALSDNEAARRMNQAREKLFQTLTARAAVA